MFPNHCKCVTDGRGIEMLQTCFDLVGARGACAAGIWVDMQRWQHPEDASGGGIGREMGLKRPLTRRMRCFRIVASTTHIRGRWNAANILRSLAP